MTAATACVRLVRQQVTTVLETDAWQSWWSAQQRRQGYVVLNNSFLFREDSRHRKRELYLAIPLSGSGDLQTDRLSIARSNIRQNADFQIRRRGPKELIEVAPLAAMLPDLIAAFGRIGLVPLGRLVDDQVFEQEIAGAEFDRLVLDPSQQQKLLVSANRIILRDLLSEEALWQELQRTLANAGSPPPSEKLASALLKSLAVLRLEAHSRLTIPATAREVDSTLLDTMIDALESALSEYQGSCEACGGDPTANPTEFNNMLRIAYNFTTDALQLVSFVSEVCDLKPAVLFMTVHGHVVLSSSLKSLPWQRLGRKASLKSYEATIKGARNAAFHRLFPFTKAIEVDLTRVPIKATRLRLFSEYEGARRARPDALEYEDRELVDLLAAFARTAAHSVAPSFWQGNLHVMEGVLELLRQFRAALVAILTDVRQ